MESGVLYSEIAFPVSAKSIIVKFECYQYFADDVVYYAID